MAVEAIARITRTGSDAARMLQGLNDEAREALRNLERINPAVAQSSRLWESLHTRIAQGSDITAEQAAHYRDLTQALTAQARVAPAALRALPSKPAAVQREIEQLAAARRERLRTVRNPAADEEYQGLRLREDTLRRMAPAAGPRTIAPQVPPPPTAAAPRRPEAPAAAAPAPMPHEPSAAPPPLPKVAGAPIPRGTVEPSPRPDLAALSPAELAVRRRVADRQRDQAEHDLDRAAQSVLADAKGREQYRARLAEKDPAYQAARAEQNALTVEEERRRGRAVEVRPALPSESGAPRRLTAAEREHYQSKGYTPAEMERATIPAGGGPLIIPPPGPVPRPDGAPQSAGAPPPPAGAPIPPGAPPPPAGQVPRPTQDQAPEPRRVRAEADEVAQAFDTEAAGMARANAEARAHDLNNRDLLRGWKENSTALRDQERELERVSTRLKGFTQLEREHIPLSRREAMQRREFARRVPDLRAGVATGHIERAALAVEAERRGGGIRARRADDAAGPVWHVCGGLRRELRRWWRLRRTYHRRRPSGLESGGRRCRHDRLRCTTTLQRRRARLLGAGGRATRCRPTLDDDRISESVHAHRGRRI